MLVTQRLSDDALYHELRADEERLEAEGIEAVYRIGDCVAPQLIADAIFDGHRLAREIDSEKPGGAAALRPRAAGERACLTGSRRSAARTPSASSRSSARRS